MASFDSSEQRRLTAILVREVGVDPRSKQRPDDCAIAPCYGVQQRRVAKPVDGVEARARLDERECNVRVVVAGRGEKWRVALRGHDGDVGAALNEKQCNVGVALHDGPIQRGGEERGLSCIRIGTGI